ncbi:spermine/spermidine synthase [Gymnopilus junonius]|uniref:Spermine/spermidine synthase n=1 Tax=Gymnopilus junonius TaxID=109634 RepID=A0A9P5NYD1_GYMJU|nr:spermine/spermidine synthase [Gymnopilus junonius]
MSAAPDTNRMDLKLEALHLICTLLPLSFVIFTHQRELIPLYGSGPTLYLLDRITFAAVILSAIVPLHVSSKRNLLYAALALTLAPNATYWIAVWTARWKYPILGPAITHAVTLGPLAFLLTTFVLTIGTSVVTQSSENLPLVERLLKASISYLVAKTLARHVWSRGAVFYTISDSQISLTMAGVFYNLWLSYPSSQPLSTPAKDASKKKRIKPSTSFTSLQKKVALLVAFNSVWWRIHHRFSNPVLLHPLVEPYTHPTYPLKILSAEESVTGLITVAEWLPPVGLESGKEEMLHSARYLRASHSILGGVWMHDKVHVLDGEQPIRDSLGTPLGDSIYSTFVVQEAVRLVNSTKKGTDDAQSNALIIGLGTGISTTAFARHGISTTIIEIDPAVYRAAHTFFGLSDPGADRIFLQDARTWVSEKIANVETQQPETLFDFVVHDCFSGGGVPEHLFTIQFWDDLKKVMQPEGVLVVNFAGILRSTSSRLIINTLERSFRHCRAFHDLFEPLSEEKYDSEFINMVIFCTKSHSSLTFRKTRKSDWLGSPLRRHVLQSMEAREVDLKTIRDTRGDDRYILTDSHNPLGALQKKQGNHHWLVMRDVLPDIHWETY